MTTTPRVDAIWRECGSLPASEFTTRITELAMEMENELAARESKPSTNEYIRYIECLKEQVEQFRTKAEDMCKLAHANACEAMEYRFLLTVARGVLKDLEAAGVEGGVEDDDHHMIRIRKALIQTAPKP